MSIFLGLVRLFTQIGHNGQNYTPGEEMPKYMVLLHDSPEAFANVSPQQMQAVIEKYMAGGEKLRASGTMLAG